MRRGGRILVLLGLVLALIAGFGVYFVLATASPEAEKVKTTQVVMAVQAISSRSEIAPEQLQSVDWPMTVPTPVGAFAEPADVSGNLAVQPLNPGQPVTKDMVISKEDNKETKTYASLIIDKGNVGIAMPVTINTNVANGIQPGDHVDILATFTAQPSQTGNSAPNAPPETASQQLLADALVLQVGPWPNPKSEEGGGALVVTLLLKEQDALVLKYSIESSGGLSLALRSANDHEIWTTEPVNLDYINKRFNFNFKNLGK
jgi:Flp pilus assembly protein CpaB